MTPSNRNEQILKLIAEGVPLTEIAKKFHISSTRVGQIRDGRRGGRVPVASKEVPHPPSNGTHPTQFENQIAYVYGRIEAQLEVYSSQLGVPFTILTRGISELLRGKESRSVLGPTHRVPRVR